VGPLTRTAFGCLVDQGYSNVIVRAAALNGTVHPTVVQTLTNAQAAGLQTAIYVVLCPGVESMDLLNSILMEIPSNLYSSTIWLKIVKNIPGCTW
jgi:Mrp family chromosome partitioning ATPase